ncbi:MAG: DUF3520 domain-containing protein, partial [Victivallales bacterium]|nr:DUF3520 domain-containing protein [Victivallales bacterium]
VAVVVCGASTHLLTRPAAVRESRRKIITAVAKLAPAGVADMESGLLLAYKIAEKNYFPGASNRVILFTDGVSNISGATAEEVLKKVASARVKGVANTIVSVGGDGDDAFLEELADKGDGNYVFIQNDSDADELFERQFSARFRAVARDVKIQVEFYPSLVAEYRQIGYDNRQLTKADFRNDKVDAGEVGAGQSVTALYELKLRLRPIPMNEENTRGTIIEALPLATVRIRYRRSDTMRVEEREFQLRSGNLAKSLDAVSPACRLAEISAEFAETLKYPNVAKIANPAAIRKKLRQLVSGVYSNDAKVAKLDALLRLSR